MGIWLVCSFESSPNRAHTTPAQSEENLPSTRPTAGTGMAGTTDVGGSGASGSEDTVEAATSLLLGGPAHRDGLSERVGVGGQQHPQGTCACSHQPSLVRDEGFE